MVGQLALKVRSAVVWFFLSASLANPVFAQEPPTERDLAGSLSAFIPSHFDVNGVEVKASEGNGDTINPMVRTRVVVSLVANEDLYRFSGTISDQTDPQFNSTKVVEQILSNGQEIKLYGVGVSRILQEQWASRFEFQNQDVLDNSGKPLSFYGPGAVIAGSPEEKAARARLEEAQAAKAAAAESRANSINEKLAGTWKGNYRCEQGVTSLTVTIDKSMAPDNIKGSFHFYDAPGYPGVEGTFPLQISYNEADGSIVAVPYGRGDLPFEFGPVGFEARFKGDEMAGTISSPGCGAIEVQREE